MTPLLEEILSLILYLLIITYITLLQFAKRRKRNHPPRYSCRIVDGVEVDKIDF
jgi:hypothetical protein